MEVDAHRKELLMDIVMLMRDAPEFQTDEAMEAWSLANLGRYRIEDIQDAIAIADALTPQTNGGTDV